jgi:hypothetical protein
LRGAGGVAVGHAVLGRGLAAGVGVAVAEDGVPSPLELCSPIGLPNAS